MDRDVRVGSSDWSTLHVPREAQTREWPTSCASHRCRPPVALGVTLTPVGLRHAPLGSETAGRFAPPSACTGRPGRTRPRWYMSPSLTGGVGAFRNQEHGSRPSASSLRSSARPRPGSGRSGMTAPSLSGEPTRTAGTPPGRRSRKAVGCGWRWWGRPQPQRLSWRHWRQGRCQPFCATTPAWPLCTAGAPPHRSAAA